MRPDAPKDTWCVDRKSQSCQGQSVFAKETAKIQICGVYQIVYQNGKLVLRNYYPETIYFKTWKCFAGTLRRSPLARPKSARPTAALKTHGPAFARLRRCSCSEQFWERRFGHRTDRPVLAGVSGTAEAEVGTLTLSVSACVMVAFLCLTENIC